MFVHRSRLPHLLDPRRYVDPGAHQREVDALFRRGWHIVATLDELPAPGDFVARPVLGVPVLVRRDEGGPRAFVNVCAHRHALLTSAAQGRLRELRCQYHGWRYDEGGRLAEVPCAASFRDERGTSPCGELGLRRLPLRTLGRLVIVAVDDAPVPFEAWLAPASRDLLASAFDERFELVVRRTLDHPCNWKVAIENVLETYHVPSLHRSWLSRHPALVRVFGGAGLPPLAERAEAVHTLADGYSEYRDVMGAEFAPYRALVHLLRGDAAPTYLHHHAYPNVVVGVTPILSFLQVLTPTAAGACRNDVWLCLHRGRGPLVALARRTAPHAAGAFLDMVLREDASVYEAVQRGLAASPHEGVLGAIEERVHAFQRWILDATP